MEEELQTADLVEAAQPNPLLRRVDGMCAAREWDGLVELARRCREAVERGKQLWPIAENIDYRLALEAPPAFAAAVLTPTAGRFAFGPLTEVAASTRTFDQLVPFCNSPQVAGVVAAERVIRGEDLTGRTQAYPEIMELPMILQPWEPDYVVPTYRSDNILVPSVEVVPLTKRGAAGKGDPIDDEGLVRSLLDLVCIWVDSSNGRAEAAVVEGPAVAAIGSLGENSFVIGEIDFKTALALMAWAGASGGAHGRRRGAAAGRSAAWWAAATLSDLEWPPHPDELGEEIASLKWYRWEPSRPLGGWSINIAIEDPQGGWSAALGAEDRAE